MLAAAMPKFDPPPPGSPALPAPLPPGDNVIQLPTFRVIDRRLPTSTEVMGQEELARYAMNKYLGPEDGLDRGALNLVTIRQFWDKIPVLGRFPFLSSETNEQRALRLYHDDLQRQLNDDLTYMSKFLKYTGKDADAAEMKRAVRADTFRQPSPSLRLVPGEAPQN